MPDDDKLVDRAKDSAQRYASGPELADGLDAFSQPPQTSLHVALAIGQSLFPVIDRKSHWRGWCVGGVHLIFPRQGSVHVAQPTP
jgi:hypothetical protein